jgi:hypothetical protein
MYFFKIGASSDKVFVANALLNSGNCVLLFKAALSDPLKFPVLAGLMVKGDAKNWEKCGSCA